MEHQGLGFSVPTDVSKEADVQILIEKIMTHYGRLDIAFNNAGVEQDSTPLAEQTEATYDRKISRQGSHLLVAIGRAPTTDSLNLAAASGSLFFPSSPFANSTSSSGGR